MCQLDPKVEEQLETTIRQFLDEGRMFTGYDVTIETRQRENIQLRHKEVRGGIHEIQLLSDAQDWGHDNPQGETVKYLRTQLTIGQGNLWAYLYYPEGADHTTYKPRDTIQQQAVSQGQAAPPATAGQTQPLSQPAAATTPSDNGSDSGGKNDDGSFSTDYRNRLFVQKSFLTALGLSKEETCHVITDASQNRVLLSSEYSDDMSTTLNGPSAITQQVERNGDLRLSSRTLRAAELDIAENFTVETSEIDVNGTQIKVVEIKQSS